LTPRRLDRYSERPSPTAEIRAAEEEAITSTAGSKSRAEEAAEKLERVRGHLADADVDGALFTRQFLVSWITAGMEDTILRADGTGFVLALVTRDEAVLVTSNIEAARITAEEAPGDVGFRVVAVPWYAGHFERAIGDLCDPGRLANDGVGPGVDASDDLQRLRLRLTAAERQRMRELGSDAAGALEHAVRGVVPGMTESDLAGKLARRLESARMFPFVVLIGSGDRRARFRHPTVSSTPIERDMLAVIVAVRGGLNIALTRTATIGPSDAALRDRHRVACEAEARAIAATRPGVRYGEALQPQLDTYEAHGYHDEWRNHTQGGPIGYGAREFGVAPLAAPDRSTRAEVELDHAVASNPTVQGAKSEDTFLVGEEANELITNTSDWPSLEVPAGDGALSRPGILELG
jgi:Xaa-Pro dipeptidase